METRLLIRGEQVEAAVAAGASLVVGGDRAGRSRGHYFAPAVVTGAPDSTDLLCEETFGPVAPIVPSDSAPPSGAGA